jgi:universal stress protein A
MRPFEKILVPVDFSQHSDEALRFAADLAGRYQASLELLHVVPTLAYGLPEGYADPSGTRFESLRNDLQTELAKKARAASDAGAPRIETTVMQGHAPSEILRFAKASGCDLIVMGTHGRSGMMRVLLGSIAQYILRMAPCPVLTIHAPGAP